MNAEWPVPALFIASELSAATESRRSYMAMVSDGSSSFSMLPRVALMVPAPISNTSTGFSDDAGGVLSHAARIRHDIKSKSDLRIRNSVIEYSRRLFLHATTAAAPADKANSPPSGAPGAAGQADAGNNEHACCHAPGCFKSKSGGKGADNTNHGAASAQPAGRQKLATKSRPSP